MSRSISEYYGAVNFPYQHRKLIPIYKVRTPCLLWVFGEEGASRVMMREPYSDEDAQYVQALFPEAELFRVP